MVMVYVPAGEFMMGSESGDDDEQPVHVVSLDGFWIDQTEITVAEFRHFVSETGHETTAEDQGWAWVWVESANDWQEVDGAAWNQPSGPGSEANPDHPVTQVSWHDAFAYCAWAGARLPTEAEWEYASRGPEALTYPWGNQFDGALLNYCDRRCLLEWADDDRDDGYVLTAPVGSYPGGASWCGALGMAGNVWEWGQDWYGSEYYGDSPSRNPAGPSSGEYRTLRGGSWADHPSTGRGANRDWYGPADTGSDTGFRCARGS
jgi:formylglycine-generating enzyme required for sulfatase activity